MMPSSSNSFAAWIRSAGLASKFCDWSTGYSTFANGGYTAGNPFDALIVGHYEGSELKFVAKVRNGFVPHVRKEVFQRFAGLATAKCPFVNLPEKRRTMWALTADEMKECRWLKPRLVAQIDFTEWTPDGHLRHSSFVGLRDDKDARDIVREIEN